MGLTSLSESLSRDSTDCVEGTRRRGAVEKLGSRRREGDLGLPSARLSGRNMSSVVAPAWQAKDLL